MAIPANSIPPPTLQRLHTLRAEGLSLRDIAAQLYKDAIPPPAGRKGWNHVLVNECLEHPPPPEPPPVQAEPPPAPAPQFQKIEEQLGKAVEQLSARIQESEERLGKDVDQMGARVQDKIGTAESQVDERLNTLNWSFTRLWVRPVCLSLAICLGVLLAAWGVVEVVAYRIDSQRETLAELKSDIEEQHATLRELEQDTWGVGYRELENGRFLVLPEDSQRTWEVGGKPAVKLPDK